MASVKPIPSIAPRTAREALGVRALEDGGCTENDPVPIVLETSSRGIDEYLQLIGNGKGQRIQRTGLRVPTAPYAPPATDFMGVGRYLFVLTSQKVGSGRRVRLRGARQMVTIGALMNPVSSFGPYVIEQPVTTPGWSFQDGNVSFSIVKIKPQPVTIHFSTATGLFGGNSDNFIYRYADPIASGALLYENYQIPAGNAKGRGEPDYYTTITGYVPPAFPLSDSISGDLNEFSDLRFEWQSDRAWDSMGVTVEGPCTIAMFASVRQTNPSTRYSNPMDADNIAPPNCMPEEQFVYYAQQRSLGSAIYWRVAGALITEDVT